MFQLTKGELEILRSQLVPSNDWKSQIETSNSAGNQEDRDWKSQNATSKFAKMGLRKQPYVFTELGVAMLSSVLRSPLAIQVNMGIMRAFVAFRHLATALPKPDVTADVVQLRKNFEELKLDIEDIMSNQNDINEDTRMQLELINESLAALQTNFRPPRRPIIGFNVPSEKV